MGTQQPTPTCGVDLRSTRCVFIGSVSAAYTVITSEASEVAESLHLRVTQMLVS